MTLDRCHADDLAGRLLWVRKKRDMTQMDLRKKSGVSQGTISDIETGRTASGYSDTLFRLAAALEVNIHWLQTGKGEPFATGDNDKDSLLAMVESLTPEQVSIAKGLMEVIKSK